MSLGKYAFYYGITTGFILALISLLAYVPGLGSVIWIVRIIALVMLTMYFVRRYRDQFNGGLLTSGAAFKLTFLIFVYIGIVAALYSGFQVKIEASKNSQEMFELLRETYDNAGMDISDSVIRNVIGIVPYLVAVFYMIGHLIIGAIFGAIYSSSLKREPQPPAENNGGTI